MPELPTLIDILRWRAVHQPDRCGYTFLEDGESVETSYTYADLDRRARAIARQLQSLGVIQERALLLYPPGLDYVAAFFGCLYAGVVAVPLYPPRPHRLDPRIQLVADDAQAAIVLTTPTILANLSCHLKHFPMLSNVRWIATDVESIPNELAELWSPSVPEASSLAFLQYTSGSTAAPRGVKVTHENLRHNLDLIRTCFDLTPQSRSVIWLPPYHDMGLIGGILQPLYTGFPVILMPPTAFLQRPIRWLQVISRYQATISGGPDFAYALCVRKIGAEQRAMLNLSHWTVAFNGAEPIRAETLEQFTAAFAACGFRPEAFCPCYGLAEATLIVSGGPPTTIPVIQTVQAAALEHHQVLPEANPESARALVGCGGILQQIAIVEPEARHLCRANQVGEIWVRAPSVAQGYWNHIEETVHTFHAYLADTGEGPFLRTGDLGFMREGELFVTGRLKDLIIIHGRNYYPQDIEQCVGQCHPALRPGGGAAFSVDVAGHEQLVIVHEVERCARRVDVETVVQAICRAVAESYALSVYAVVLLKPGGVPKTSSGKVERHRCRAWFLAGELEGIESRRVAPDPLLQATSVVTELSRATWQATPPEVRSTLLEEYLQHAVAQLLNLPPAQVDCRSPLIHLGVDSLRAVELSHKIEASLGTALPMAEILQNASITQLASHLLAALSMHDLPSPVSHCAPHEVGTDIPLSHGQRALWFLHQLAPESAAYHIASAVTIRGDLDVPALRRSFQTLVERHEALRTTFHAQQGEPSQRVHDWMEVFFQIVDAREWQQATLTTQLAQVAYQPFDLERGPLLRVYVFHRSASEHLLLLVVHHLVADLWSLAVLAQELGQLYPATRSGMHLDLAAPRRQYRDYVRCQIDRLAGAEGEHLWAYWQQQLAGELPVLNVPTDHPRPPIQTYMGAAETLVLTPDVAQRLGALSHASGVTLYMTLLAVFHVLLYRYTGQNDILVGSPTSGRGAVEWSRLVGYLVNPVVLRTSPNGQMRFTEFLHQVRQVVFEALAHQDYPFDLLVERLQPTRDPGHSPIFQVMFIFQQTPPVEVDDLAAFSLGIKGTRTALGGLPLEVVPLEQRAAQFDLTLTMAEVAGGLGATLHYNRDLFDTSSIRRMLAHFQCLLEGITINPDQRLADLPLLTEAERTQLLEVWNDTEVRLSTDVCLPDLLEAQVERIPDTVALVFEDEHVTYAALNARSNRLAHALQALGVGPDAVVAVCLERSIDLVVSLLGILKAGGAYVPLDPAYPVGHLATMLSDSQGLALITHSALRQRLPSGHDLAVPTVLYLDAMYDVLARASKENPVRRVTAEHLAYVLYTSGSTGRPKGVQITNRALVNFLMSMQVCPGLSTTDTLLAVTTLSFDIAGLELYLPLVVGARVVLTRRDEALDGTALLARLQETYTTVLQATPTTWRLLLAAGWAGQPRLKALCGGEALPRSLADQLLAQGAQLWNLYGPTETTIWSTVERVTGEPGPVSVGRPIANTQVYLLDAHGQPVPVGIPGEVHIGGTGVARGYLHLPDLTAERFVPDPFGAQPGMRLYRTGDVARYRADGRLEYLGRRDQQVKVRGYRIEVEEIEAVLERHPAVQQAVVVCADEQYELVTTSVGQHLVAYVVPSPEYVGVTATGTDPRETWIADQHVIWENAYQQLPAAPNPQFNTAGWNSSYTGQPMSTVEMREWVAHTVARIRVWEPDRVLEIGCGTGLLLHQLAPHCQQYWGTDFSATALAYIQQHLSTTAQVTLLHRRADEFDGIAPASFDAVVLNSVVQYFPSSEYLLQVLEQAVMATAPGGLIFVGDVRSLPLLPAFQLSLELAQSSANLPPARLHQRLALRRSHESELVLDPRFFAALQRRIPRVGAVQMQPKRGQLHNELTRFRYDVTLHLDREGGCPVEPGAWLNWSSMGLSLAELRVYLRESQPAVLGVQRVPNARVQAECQILDQLVREVGEPASIEWGRDDAHIGGMGIDPDALWALGDELGYQVDLSWASGRSDGSYDVIFQITGGAPRSAVTVFPATPLALEPEGAYATRPLDGQWRRARTTYLRQYLKDSLPEYLVPSAFVYLDCLPLTPNGKVDRRALPAPDNARRDLETAYVAPRTALEAMLAEIWASVIGIERIGVHDNFFKLGGHSLLATRVLARIRAACHVDVPLRAFFEAPSVAHLAQAIEAALVQSTGKSNSRIRTASREQYRVQVLSNGGLALPDDVRERLKGFEV